jgi:hypothetical protein
MKLLRSVVLGWVTLLGIAYLIERPLIHWTRPLFGAMWIATAHLAFDCLTLAAAGWVAGRLDREHAVRTGAVFAATLCFWDFAGLVAVNVPWLARLVWNSFQDSRFLDSLALSAETHALLFGCLIGGAMLGRPRAKPASILTSFI